MSEQPILVTGATGDTGAATIQTLQSLGKNVRATVRTDDERAAALRDKGVDVRVANFMDIDSLRDALDEVSAALFVYPIAPGILDATAYFAQAASEAEVPAIVNMSQISARREATSHAAQDHWVAERIFDRFDLAVTHLRPTFFAQWLTYPHFAGDIWDRKTIEFPFADARHAPIAAEDIGRFAAHILANPEGHGGNIYPVTGPVELDHYEIAEVVSEVLGSKIRYNPISDEQFESQLTSLGFPDFLIQHLLEVSRDYRDGVFEGADKIVTEVTGTAPMSVREFVTRHQGAFQSASAHA